VHVGALPHGNGPSASKLALTSFLLKEYVKTPR